MSPDQFSSGFSFQQSRLMYNTLIMDLLPKNRLKNIKLPKRGEKNGGKNGTSGKPRSFWNNALTTIFIFLVLMTIYSFLTESGSKTPVISLSQLATDVSSGLVSKITVQGDNLEVEYLKNHEIKKAKKEEGTALTTTLVNYGVPLAKLSTLQIEVKSESGIGFWILNLAPFVLPLVFILIFIWFLSRQVKGAGMQAFTFGQSKARITFPSDKKTKVTFKDVAGAKEAKEELKEIVDFLKSPKKFLDIGAVIPKGVLLMGASGTGKTLLARAVAGEAGVAFFSISGSEFVEMFVGVGASVTGDTPVLIKTKRQTRLMPISEFVDQYYKKQESGGVRKVKEVKTLGFAPLESKFWGVKNSGKHYFGGSSWSEVQSVLRHRVDKIYKIYYRGGLIKTTGDHSIFVRHRNMITAKRADELKPGDILVNLPFKVRGTFIPGIGTTHKVKAHTFLDDGVQYLDLYDEAYQKALAGYKQVIAEKGIRSQYAIAAEVGVSQATVGNWQNGVHEPQFFGNNLLSVGTPRKLLVTPDLMRLLGYYTAEGRVTRYMVDFVFGMHEPEIYNDCRELLCTIFKLEPTLVERPESNSVRITVSSPILGQFFEKHAGTGSHRKHVPEILWSLPKPLFLAYLSGYERGDGYTTRDGKLSVVSVSKQLIMELAWLRAMHGIQAGMRQTLAPAGRTIGSNLKPLPETISWNLIIGKTAHPFISYTGTASQFKKPIVERVISEPYDGYVYDLCGCENEAFFGGEKPILLHNSRVRDLFKLAKSAAPSIIFVDEIDAVGRVRGHGAGGGNDEREQTLNQILVEMDGFEQNEKVVVMAATNRPDVLDPALVRPGRFDRRVVLDLPDRADREEILKIHAVKKPFAEDVNLSVVAERTPGFSGADLYSLMNEAAILAARENRLKVAQFDLIRSIEKVMLGPERKSHILSAQEKEITAYHEAGHALVASVLPFADPVHKISIISRGRAAGYTLKLPLEDRKLQSRREFLDDIAVSLGGYVAEKMIFGDLTTGPSNDLQVSTALARDMVTKYGMSDKMGPVALEGAGGRVLFGRGVDDREFSERVGSEVDAEVSRIMNEGRLKAEEILKKHRKALDAIASRLIEVENIEQAEYETIILAFGIAPKKKERKEERA